MANDVESKLKNIKKNIDDAKTQLGQAEGSMKTLLKRLTDEFGISNVEQAQKRRTVIVNELKTIDKTIEDKIEHVERTFVLD